MSVSQVSRSKNTQPAAKTAEDRRRRRRRTVTLKEGVIARYYVAWKQQQLFLRPELKLFLFFLCSFFLEIIFHVASKGKAKAIPASIQWVSGSQSAVSLLLRSFVREPIFSPLSLSLFRSKKFQCEEEEEKCFKKVEWAKIERTYSEGRQSKEEYSKQLLY